MHGSEDAETLPNGVILLNAVVGKRYRDTTFGAYMVCGGISITTTYHTAITYD
jgi:hypothetical protein